MGVHDSVDRFTSGWSSFAEFFAARRSHGPFLIELDHEHGTRAEWTTEAWRRRVGATGRWLADRGVAPGDRAELLAHFARHLDFAYQPKVVVVFGDDVPYIATGKAKRLELERSLAARLAAHRDTQFRKQRTGEERPR